MSMTDLVDRLRRAADADDEAANARINALVDTIIDTISDHVGDDMPIEEPLLALVAAAFQYAVRGCGADPANTVKIIGLMLQNFAGQEAAAE